MDKVIIDGVDVSGCEFFEFDNILGYQCYEYIAEDGASPADNCNNRANCYYKQLKRKEQECEELKKQVEYDSRYNDMQAENERLKNSLEICQGLCKTLEEAKANEHNHWFNRCCEINTECDKYRQALQEIRDIANIIYNTNCNYVAESHKIIDKINEVIGAE